MFIRCVGRESREDANVDEESAQLQSNQSMDLKLFESPRSMKTLGKEIEGEIRERGADVTKNQKRTKHSENLRDEQGKNNAQKPYECGAQARLMSLVVHLLYEL